MDWGKLLFGVVLGGRIAEVGAKEISGPIVAAALWEQKPPCPFCGSVSRALQAEWKYERREWRVHHVYGIGRVKAGFRAYFEVTLYCRIVVNRSSCGYQATGISHPIAHPHVHAFESGISRPARSHSQISSVA